jgi:plasmid stabilization system protein ParE
MGREPPVIVRRSTAIVHVIGIADCLAGHASIAAADRFTASVKKTAEKLARMPGIGTRGDFSYGFLAETRAP